MEVVARKDGDYVVAERVPCDEAWRWRLQSAARPLYARPGVCNPLADLLAAGFQERNSEELTRVEPPLADCVNATTRTDAWSLHVLDLPTQSFCSLLTLPDHQRLTRCAMIPRVATHRALHDSRFACTASGPRKQTAALESTLPDIGIV